MRPSLPVRVAIVFSVAALLCLAAWVYLQTHDVGHTIRQFKMGHPMTAPPRRHGPGLDGFNQTLERLRWILQTVLVGSTAIATTISVNRWRWRRRRARTTSTVELRLGRDDLANPYRVQEAFEGISGAITARWYARLWRGQDHFALEIHRLEDAGIRFTVAAPAALLPAIKGPLEELYPDVALEPISGRPPAPRHVVRLKKRRCFVLSIQTARNYEHAFVESLTSLMTSHSDPVSVQLVLAPAAGRTHRRARKLLKKRERSLQHADRRDGAEIGIDSVVEAKELKGALETQHRSLLFFDLRVSGPDPVVVRRVAGLYAQVRSENELTPRHMRVRRDVFASRIRSALPNPVPSMITGVFSTSELATVWQLPRGRSKHAAFERSTVRRASAPPQIDRSAERILMQDERGPVCISPPDRKYGHALIGGQGTGKSSVMARHFANDARDRDRSIILVDPKGPLARLCRGLAPADRVVHYLDLGRPETGINPLTIDASPGTRAAVLLRALIEANPPGAIQAASDSFLRQSINAVCTVEADPTLWHVYAMLDLTDSEYRTKVINLLSEDPAGGFARHYWVNVFPQLVKDRSFAAQALNAPRNKLERLISTRDIDLLLRHPAAVDIDAILENNEILIVAGGKADVGEDNTLLVTHLLLQLLQRTLQHRQENGHGGVSPVSLLIDEAHNVLTPSVARMLAEGRSAGLEAVFAWQYSGQVRDEVIRSGVRSLLQSITVFRMREMEDARSLSGLAMEIYSDRIGIDQDEQERLRFSADDIVRLPIHQAINLWVADTAPRPGFVAHTLPMEPLHDETLVEHHAKAQAERGGFHPTDLRDPGLTDAEPPKEQPAESESAPDLSNRPKTKRSSGPRVDRDQLAMPWRSDDSATGGAT